jgi:O-antigen/teichoic acid export membrane protein
MPSNTARIAKNTLMLYFRQILILMVSLYTVRVVLNTLGAQDYGIYNVAAEIVTMFDFLSNFMASASQRYFAFEIGRDDFEQLRQVVVI